MTILDPYEPRDTTPGVGESQSCPTVALILSLAAAGPKILEGHLSFPNCYPVLQGPWLPTVASANPGGEHRYRVAAVQGSTLWWGRRKVTWLVKPTGWQVFAAAAQHMRASKSVLLELKTKRILLPLYEEQHIQFSA